MLQRVQGTKNSPLAKAYDVDALPQALEGMGYTLEKELKQLWELTQHPDPKVALKAQSNWRATLKDIRLANAVLLTMTTKEDGTQERTQTAVAMLETLAQENANAQTVRKVTHEHHAPSRPDEAKEAPVREADPPYRDAGVPEPGAFDDLFPAGAIEAAVRRHTDSNCQAPPGGGEGIGQAEHD